jgi:MFS family permease
VLSIYLFLFHFKLETPFFLFIIKQDYFNSEKALEQIYVEKTEIKQILNDYISLSESRNANITFRDLFNTKYRKRFLVALMLLITQQACGIDAFLMYSNSLFMQSVHDERKATILTNFCGVFLIFSGITTILIIERLGRKLILIIGQFIMIIILVLLAYFYYVNEHKPVVYLIFSYIFVNGVSLSPISFIYSADVLPEIGMGFGLAINNAFCFFVTETFMYLASSVVGTYGLMLIFASFVFLDLIIIVIFLKETNGLSADEIDKMYTPKKVAILLDE